METPTYDDRHGSPYDRGSADAYYKRYGPHFYRGASYHSERVEACDMSAEELAAYAAGYAAQEEHKKWWR